MRYSRTAAFMLLCAALLLVHSTLLAQEATEEPPASPEPETTQEAPEPEPEVTEAAPTPAPTGTVHVVQRGENLFRIALRYGTTVSALAAANGITNPNLVYVGQQLRIPGTEAPAPVPTPTPAPGTDAPAGGTYVVQPGDNLYRIALRNSTTVAQLVALNNIGNPNLIFVGQRLTLPGAAPADTTAPGDTETPDTTQPAVEDPGFAYGVEVYITAENPPILSGQVAQLGLSWVKIVVDWRAMEPIQGQVDFTALDMAVNTFNSGGLNILMTVTSAPDWARPSAQADNLVENGPPDDFATFAAFVTSLAERYVGRVNAYEIWNEPNLRREWNSPVHSINAGAYVHLLEAASIAIRAADPAALVISAGLAPTGFNDGVNAIDDRVFLQDMYSNRVTDFADGIGAHPNGWANPPDSVCCNQPPGVDTHFDNPRFYFLNTLNDYRAIMVRNGDTSTAIWVTRFGWGSSEDTTPPSANNIFLTYTSLSEQALYVPRAFDLARELGFVGPMFLFNLNGCQVSTEACYYGLIDPQGVTRPVFSALQALDKTGGE